MVEIELRAEVGMPPVRSVDGEVFDLDELVLSDRLLSALADWAQFFDDVGGAISDADVAEEFVGQGFRIAHALRRELKGSRVWLEHPITQERIEVHLQAPR